MRAVGAPVFRHLLSVYTLGGAVAGIAGALSAQTTQIVGFKQYGFELSAEGLVMLTIGGVGHLAGALLGVPAFIDHPARRRFHQSLSLAAGDRRVADRHHTVHAARNSRALRKVARGVGARSK